MDEVFNKTLSTGDVAEYNHNFDDYFCQHITFGECWTHFDKTQLTDENYNELLENYEIVRREWELNPVVQTVDKLLKCYGMWEGIKLKHTYRLLLQEEAAKHRQL